MKAGDRVKVDFIGESATIYSGKRFTGYGVLDRVEDGRVFGRLDDGTPFMCLCADVEVVGMSDFEKWFKSLNENGRVTYFLGQEGRISEEAWNHQQAIIDEHTEVIKLQDADLRKYEKQIESLKAQLNNMEQCYIQLKQINNEQAEIIRGHFSARQEMKKCIDAALYDIAQAKDGFYGYSSDGGDVDNLTKNIEKSLRGER